jgi:hypothetical protein
MVAWSAQWVLVHEMNRDQKPLLETSETEHSGLANWRVQFCQDQWQSGVPLGFNEVLLPQPSDFSTLFMLQNMLDLQIFQFSSFLVLL